MGITKNHQTEEQIRQSSHAVYPNRKIKTITELTEGMCNAAYLLQFADGSSSVLKVAAENERGRMTNEKNLMRAEVRAMQLMEQQKKVKVAKVHYYDTSRTICNGDYFFMEALKGQSFYSAMSEMSEAEKNTIHYEIGEVERAISEIKGEFFGLLGDDEHRYVLLYEFVYDLIRNVLKDAAAKHVDLGVEEKQVLMQLEKDSHFFAEVKKPMLVHWDMWEGNIFVYEGHVSGIIDWERAMWGEALMDDRFRRHTRHEQFLRGYGKEVFSDEENRRILWYDILLYLTMMTEGAYREYEDDSQYQWVKPLFEASWRAVLGE